MARVFSGPSHHAPFWFKPVSIFGLFYLTTVAAVHNFVDHAAQPSPRTPSMLGVLVPVLRPSLRRDWRGYIVPAASHRAVASAACAGRLPVMEHRVLPFLLYLLSSNNHSSDFTSHEHAIISQQESALIPLVALLGVEVFAALL